jgi:hypothetical protein
VNEGSPGIEDHVKETHWRIGVGSYLVSCINRASSQRAIFEVPVSDAFSSNGHLLTGTVTLVEMK